MNDSERGVTQQNFSGGLVYVELARITREAYRTNQNSSFRKDELHFLSRSVAALGLDDANETGKVALMQMSERKENEQNERKRLHDCGKLFSTQHPREKDRLTKTGINPCPVEIKSCPLFPLLSQKKSIVAGFQVSWEDFLLSWGITKTRPNNRMSQKHKCDNKGVDDMSLVFNTETNTCMKMATPRLRSIFLLPISPHMLKAERCPGPTPLPRPTHEKANTETHACVRTQKEEETGTPGHPAQEAITHRGGASHLKIESLLASRYGPSGKWSQKSIP
ncbi:hypothetical protein EYF80_000093 [Liparis tanakae]|uniref:Uncharacterized protein n=1 Tax=Liparis tanakae TaxID=230148 RepID=A0A4Z2JH47_9TELE|nr:hypothetical protein EYF80_000093 [Liparis tanakae]